VLALLTFPVARLLPVFAARANEERLGWRDAWKLSRGAGWRLAAALIVVGAVWAVLVGALAYLMRETGLAVPYDRIVFDIAFAVVNTVFVAIGSASNAYVFRALTGTDKDSDGTRQST
jgi:hypothetical protein